MRSVFLFFFKHENSCIQDVIRMHSCYIYGYKQSCQLTSMLLKLSIILAITGKLLPNWLNTVQHSTYLTPGLNIVVAIALSQTFCWRCPNVQQFSFRSLLDMATWPCQVKECKIISEPSLLTGWLTSWLAG